MPDFSQGDKENNLGEDIANNLIMLCQNMMWVHIVVQI